MENKIVILYVDDEPNNLTAFSAYFRRNKNLILLTANSGDEGLQVLKVINAHIIISDQKKPHMTGVEFLESAGEKYSDAIRLVVTAHRDNKVLEQACKEGKIYKYHDKPWDMNYLEDLIEEAYELYLERKKITK